MPGEWDDRKGIIAAISRFSHDHYYIVLVLFVVITLGLTAVIMMVPANKKCALQGGQFTVCESSNHDWELSHTSTSKYKDAVGAVRNDGVIKFNEITGRAMNTEMRPRSASAEMQNLYIIYNHDDQEKNAAKSIFTPARIQAMCKTEAVITTHPLYRLFCEVEETGKCKDQLLSPLRYFYKEPNKRDPAKGGCQLISETAAQEGTAKIFEDQSGIGVFFLSNKALEAKYTNKTRSNIRLGLPLPGYKDGSDDKDAQGKLYDLFYAGLDCKVFTAALTGEFKKYTGENPCKDKDDDFFIEGIESLLMTSFRISGTPARPLLGGVVPVGALRSGYMGADPGIEISDGNLEVRFWSLAFQQVEFDRVVDADLYYSILSIFAVWCYFANVLLMCC